MEGFVSWFFREKGWLDTASMGLTDISGQGRGAVALKDIPEGHVLFTIPRPLTLSTRTSELPSRFGDAAWKSLQLNKGWVGLILCMMWEEAQRADAKWAEYLETLPKTFDTPMFWNDDELKELEGTAVKEKIGREEAERDYYERLLPAVHTRADLFDPAHLSTLYSLENYHRMGSRILSRSFHVEKWQGEDEQEKNEEQPEPQAAVEPVDQDMDVDEDHRADEVNEAEDEDSDDDDDPSDVAMVPMADMLNARYGSENAKLFYEPLELRMVTTKPIKAGEQIYNTYGDPPNSELLRKYGHVDLVPLLDEPAREGNPADVVEVRADLAVEVVSSTHKINSQEILKERIDWWLEEGGDDVFVIGTDLELPEELISFFKLLLLPSSEWEKARSKGKPPKPKLDQEAKVQILPLVLTLFERRLAQYPTTLQHDETLLATSSSTLSNNTRNAIVVRAGEKQILMGCTAKCKSLFEEAQTAIRDGKRPVKAADQKKRKRGKGADGDEEEKSRKRSGR